MKIINSLKILLMLSIAFILIACSEEKEDDKEIINVACNLPFTGYVGIYGEWMKNGINMAMYDHSEELQANGIKINFDFQDNRGENKDAVNIWKKQKNSSPDLVFSGLTGQTMSIMDEVSKNKIPHFLLSFTPLFLEKGKMTYRTFPNFGIESRHIIEFIAKNKPTKIVFLYKDIVGTSLQINNVVIPSIKNKNIEILNIKYPVSVKDFKSYAIDIKTFDPDMIVANGFVSNIPNIINTFSEYNLNLKKSYFSMDILDLTNQIDLKLLNGIYTTAPQFLVKSKRGKIMEQWNTRFKKIHGRDAKYFELYAYEMTSIIIKASIEKKNSNISLDDALKSISFSGISGIVKFDETGEMMHTMYTSCFNNGELLVD